MSKRGPAGVLVLYDEAKGLRRPQAQVFGPSPTIERDVNDWIDQEKGIRVHRIDWIPSGGQLGASVTYSRGGEATQSLQIVVPGLEAAEKRARAKGPIEALARFLLSAGVVFAVIGMAMFAAFYPETWTGGTAALMDPALAVKMTVLTVGTGLLLIFAAVSALFRARVS